MQAIVRGLSFGFLMAAAAFGGALVEYGLLSVPAHGAAQFLPAISPSTVPRQVPLRGSQDMDAPLLLPFEGPHIPHKTPVRKHGSPGMKFASGPLLDTGMRAG